MNRPLIFFALLVPLLVVLGAAPAMAQYGQIEGLVKDQTGGVLPGATVTATNEETGVTRSAVTGESGSYRLPGLPPGVYTVTAEMSGFQTRSYTGIILTIQQTVIQQFDLDVAQLSETITVTGESPVIDTKRSDVSTSVSEDQIQDLPVASRRWVDLAMLTPGVSQDAIRGFYYRGNVNMGAGGRYYSNGFIVDGVNNTWAEMGEARQNFPMDSIGEFQVTTSNFKAEYGLATGGVMTVVSKSGTNNIHGSAFLFFRDDSLNSKSYFESEKPPYNRQQFGGSLGGPIVKDKAHYFVSYERTTEDVFFTVNTGGVFPEVDGTKPSEQSRYMWLAKANYEVSPKHSTWVRVAWEDEYRPNLNAGGTTAKGFDFAVPRNSEVFGWTWLASDSAMNEFRFQRAFSKYEVSPAYTHGSWDPGDFNAGRIADCDVIFTRPSLNDGSCNDQMGPEIRWQFKDDMTYFKSGWGGDHQFKFGADYNYIEFSADSLINANGRWWFPTDLPYNANDPTTFPERYEDTLPRFDSVPVHHISFYFQDDWNPKPGLTLNLGLRYDLQKGTFNEDIQDIDFGVFIPWHVGADQRGDKNNLGPRVGFAWDVTDTGRTVVKGGYGIFYDNVRTLTNFGERWWNQQQQVRIVNPSYPDPYQGVPRDEFVSGAAPNIEVLSNSLENPYAHHFNVGVSTMLTTEVALSVDFTRVRGYGDREDVDVNYPLAEGEARPYPEFARVNEGRSQWEHRYTGFFAKITKRLSNGYQFLASYTLSKDEDYGNRIDDITEWGYQPVWYPSGSDRRHRLVVSGIYQAPYGINVSTIMDFRSALPFNIHSGADLNSDGFGSDLASGIPYNTGRDPNLDAINAYRTGLGSDPVNRDDIANPNFINVDLRVQKAFAIKGPHQMQAIFQVLNLLDRANFNVPNGNMRSSGFGQVNQILPNINAPARQIELAIRYVF